MFHPESWGFGYAGEAVRAVLTWAAEEARLQRVIAVTQSRNVRSLALLEHVGMGPRATDRRARGDASHPFIPRWVEGVDVAVTVVARVAELAIAEART